MRNFKEFVGVFVSEDDITGSKKDDNAYLTIDLNRVIAWNQLENDQVAMELEGGCRYTLDISYHDFTKIMFKTVQEVPAIL